MNLSGIAFKDGFELNPNKDQFDFDWPFLSRWWVCQRSHQRRIKKRVIEDKGKEESSNWEDSIQTQVRVSLTDSNQIRTGSA